MTILNEKAIDIVNGGITCRIEVTDGCDDDRYKGQGLFMKELKKYEYIDVNGASDDEVPMCPPIENYSN